MLHKKYLLGVGITPEKTSTILEYVIEQLHKGKKKLFLVTPNPEILVYAQKHLSYKDKLNAADLALPDGVGILLASRLLGLGIAERTTGVDFIEKLCEMSREKPVSMGFLGGRHGVAERTAECLKEKYPWIEVVFAGEEMPAHVTGPVSSSSRPTSSVTSFPAGARREPSAPATRFSSLPEMDILFVAYGFPKQEEWIYENLEKLSVKAAMGVGGAFDYISGQVPRAPKGMRAVGLEWLFRLIVQPWRLRRQVALLKFISLIVKERFSK
jgi:N-acetylglucosaminyldiphosphoundecaprenol N-acetyl-beta-D-mannosaminyltransferase